jgi:hypothetical protein
LVVALSCLQTSPVVKLCSIFVRFLVHVLLSAGFSACVISRTFSRLSTIIPVTVLARDGSLFLLSSMLRCVLYLCIIFICLFFPRGVLVREPSSVTDLYGFLGLCKFSL